MNKLLMLDKSTFALEFERCCKHYSNLQMASAWCGNPAHILPYSFLTSEENNLKVEVVMGVSFNRSHPDAIQFFQKNRFSLRIIKKSSDLFHPKCYLFKDGDKFAFFIGSSNFTYSGFYDNTEINLLFEGTSTKEIALFNKQFKDWKSDKYSFIPNAIWLNKYREAYTKQRDSERNNRIETPNDREESISHSNWLTKANWKLFFQEVQKGLIAKERNEFGYNAVLDAAKANLPLPWKETIFNDIENRRIIGGLGRYGWLGHVASSGKFRQLMANGSISNKRKIATAINNVCNLETPLKVDKLSKYLQLLIDTGPSIKVWSRVITILRPDLYCTVSAPSVRENLSQTLNMNKSELVTVDGYIQLIKLIHSCPWYNSQKPKSKSEIIVWERRAAFMDAIFY